MSVAANQSYSKAMAITKSDTLNLDGSDSTYGQNVLPSDAVYVGTGGVVAAVFQNGVVVNFTAASGETLPLRVIRVNDTDTTADKMVAFYAV